MLHRFMPPTKPFGDPCIAVVLAKTIADGIDYGVMPFLVPINDGVEMYPGVVCRHVFSKFLRPNNSHFDQIPDTAGRYQPFKSCDNVF